MIVLSCENIDFSFGADKILSKVSFGLNEGDKLGIVGVNGAGKSTLLKILRGEYSADSGNVYSARDKCIGFLDQDPDLDADGTVMDEALKAFSELIRTESRIEELKAEIDSGDIGKASEFSALHERFTAAGGYEFRGRVKGMLKSMNLPEQVWDIKVSSLSGGQKTRLAISCLLLKEPDILMLDEPTNHLDTDALEWLEDFIRLYRKTVIIISHDRYFLDRTATKILEIENTFAKLYSGNYTDYVKQKATDREIQERHFKNQQREIARIEAYIEQQRRWNRERNIIAAESRQKLLDKMEKIERPEALPDKISLSFEQSIESGNEVVRISGLSAAYGEKKLFSDFGATVFKREHVFVLGENGCGKSTLIKTLVGKLPAASGNIEYGYNVRVGYYDQENQQLDDGNTVMDELWNCFEKLSMTQIRGALARFLFKGDDVFKNVGMLSGGERARLTLAKLMLSRTNLLILDEPTNHLDINSREALEDALLGYDGTLIAVSHDRYFVNKLADRIFEFEKDGSGRIFDFKGSYSEFREFRAGKTGAPAGSGTANTVKSGKEQYLNEKKDISERRKNESRMRRAKEEEARIEARIEEIDAEMQGDAASDHVKLSELYEEKERLEERLMELLELLEG